LTVGEKAKKGPRQRALSWSAVINDIVGVPLMVILMITSANTAIVKEFSLPVHVRIVGWTAAVVMLLASLAFIASGIRG
jgi:Mn2+/Fe2+ NRAMP family transporter